MSEKISAAETRRIVQIASAGSVSGASYMDPEFVLFALCNDGTVWRLVRRERFSIEFVWQGIEEIPQ